VSLPRKHVLWSWTDAEDEGMVDALADDLFTWLPSHKDEMNRPL